MSELGQGLIEALKEARDHMQGKVKLRTTVVTIPEVKVFTSEEVKNLRKSLGVSQTTFANAMGVSNRTVEEWERGKNTPSGSSSRLMEIIQKAPDTLQYLGLLQ